MCWYSEVRNDNDDDSCFLPDHTISRLIIALAAAFWPDVSCSFPDLSEPNNIEKLRTTNWTGAESQTDFRVLKKIKVPCPITYWERA